MKTVNKWKKKTCTRVLVLVIAWGLTPFSALAEEKSLEKSGFLEDCVRAQAGETLRYELKADKPVFADIHYHNKEDKKDFLVKEELTSGISGETQAVVDTIYCLMVVNRENENAVQVQTTIEVVKR